MSNFTRKADPRIIYITITHLSLRSQDQSDLPTTQHLSFKRSVYYMLLVPRTSPELHIALSCGVPKASMHTHTIQSITQKRQPISMEHQTLLEIEQLHVVLRSESRIGIMLSKPVCLACDVSISCFGEVLFLTHCFHDLVPTQYIGRTYQNSSSALLLLSQES